MPRDDTFREESGSFVKTSKRFRKRGETTHGMGRAKVKRKGQRVSFAVPGGRKSGKVIEVHKEFYIVKAGKRFHKVNRNSILYSMGFYIGRIAGAPAGVRKRVKKITKRTRAEFQTGKRQTIKRIGEGKPSLARTRTFGSQTFRLKSSHRKKSKADQVAKGFRRRSKGNQARVEKVQGRWRVYTRG